MSQVTLVVQNLKVLQYFLLFFNLNEDSFMAGTKLCELPQSSFFELNKVKFCLRGAFDLCYAIKHNKA